MVRSKVRGGHGSYRQALSLPQTLHLASRYCRPRDQGHCIHLQQSQPSTLQQSTKWTTTRARECVLRSLTPTTLLPSNASATCRGSPTPQPDPTLLHHSLRLLLFNPFTCLRLDLRYTPRRANHIPGAYRCMRLVIMGGLARGSCSPPSGIRCRPADR